MAIYLDSNNTTNTVYQGSFTLPVKMLGEYTVIHQTFSGDGSIAWINENNNQIEMVSFAVDGLETLGHEETIQLNWETLQYETDRQIIAETIAENIQTQLGADTSPGFQRTVTGTVENNAIKITFNDIVTMMWDSPNTTARNVLGKGNVENEPGVTETILEPDTDSPNYLEMYIEEAESYIATSHGTTPTILVNVTGNEFVGQTIKIGEETSVLNFYFQNPHDSNKQVTFNKTWTLGLQ